MYKEEDWIRQIRIPQGAEEAIALLKNGGEEYTTYLAFLINEPITGEFAVGFMSPKWYNTLQFDSETLLQADATFYVVPKQFYSYLTSFSSLKSYTLPALHILMSRKSSSLYERIVKQN